MTAPENSTLNDKELSQLSARIDDLVQRIDFIADPAVRANVVTLIQTLTDLHAEGFARITQLLAQEGEAGQRIFRNLAGDEIVGGLLLLYNCHPDSLETRVEKAMERIEDYLRPSGASATLLGLENEVVRIHLNVNATGCGAGEAAEKTIESFIYSAAPEITSIQIERQPARAHITELVQLRVDAAAGD